MPILFLILIAIILVVALFGRDIFSRRNTGIEEPDALGRDESIEKRIRDGLLDKIEDLVRPRAGDAENAPSLPADPPDKPKVFSSIDELDAFYARERERLNAEEDED